MRCPSCQSENREGRRFCAACGESLPIACPSCGFANLPEEKFCGGCGAALQAGTAPRPQTAAEPPQPELRPATVLFADLVGFTSLANRVDPEALQAWLDRFFESADAEVVRFGGSVDKHIGDGLMAVFGAPVAHDNDPERAAHCSQALHALSIDAPDGGGPVRLHIGIAAGTVMASPSGSSLHRSYTVTGPSVNLAARLCELSAPGETLVSEAVALAVGDRFEVEPMGPVQVAGFDAAVPTWRMHRAHAGAARRSASPLIGRVRETRQIAGILDACRESGSGQAIVLRGEAGIGKTRLVEAVEEMARDRGFAAAKAAIVDFGGGLQRDPTRLLAAALLDLPAAADEGARRAKLEQALEAGLAAGPGRAALADLLDLPLEQEMRRLYDAMPAQARIDAVERLLSDLVRAAAGRCPRLLILEDVHWADGTMLSRIATVANAAADVSCIVLLTTRISGDPLDAAWRARLRAVAVATVDLAPLNRQDSLLLAGTLRGRATQDFGPLVDRAEGNPLFLVQLARHADESLGTALPGSIQSAVLARADRLAPEQKRLLQTAAVLGQRFAPEVLQHVAEQATASVEALVAHGLMRSAGADVVFAHALVHEAIYASLPKSRRETLHRRAADWYRSRDPALYAQHLGRAQDSAAAGAYLEAAASARAAYRLEQALRLVEEGGTAPGAERLRFGLAVERGSLLHDLGRIEDATAAYEGALDLAAKPEERCRALIGLAAAMRISDRIDAALAALDEAQGIATALDRNLELARIHYLRGSLYFPRARVRESRAEHELALAHARRAASAEVEALALSGLGDAFYAEGRMLSAADAFSRCVSLAREHGFGRIEVANLPMLAFTRFFSGEVRPAMEIGMSAAAAARRVGARRGEIIAHHLVFAANLELNELGEAKKALDAGHVSAVELKARRFEAESLGFMAQHARIAGDRATAVVRAREAVALARQTGMEYIGGIVLGELAAAAEDEAEARAAQDEALVLLKRGTLAHNHLWFYRAAIEASLDRGTWEDLPRWAEGLEAVTRDQPLRYTELLIRFARLAARRLQSRTDSAAAAELDALAAKFAELGFVRLAQMAASLS